MLNDDQKIIIASRVRKLISQVGIKVEHDIVSAHMKSRGCFETADGRIAIPEQLLDEFVSYQKKTRKTDDENQKLHPFCGIDWTHHIIWNDRKDEMLDKINTSFAISAFDCGPTKYYDYRQNKALPVDLDIFTEIMKFAEATPEIGYISTWYRQDTEPRIERIESLVMGLKITRKLDGIEAIYPEVIKYLKEISEIITGKAGDASYLAGSQCITPPLVLERRSAEDMLERARLEIHKYHIGSMLTIGMNTPITVMSSAILGAAEILGGMIAAWCVDPAGCITGRMISSIVDMKNCNVVIAGPETTMVNIAVKEVFDMCFEGHLWVEVFFSPTAKKPGLQAVTENYEGGSRYAYLTENPNICYPGMGTLDNGGLGSPAQFMLDMEIRKTEYAAKKRIDSSEESVLFDELCSAVRDRSGFFTCEHTLEHFNEIWSSKIFHSDTPSDRWPGDEKCILDRCDEMWRENIKRYSPPEWPDIKLKALDRLLQRVKREMLG